MTTTDDGSDADARVASPEAKTNPTDLRIALVANGYTPVPLHGKRPCAKDWQRFNGVTRSMIEAWWMHWPDAFNTGVLTACVPALDLDVLDEEAAEACEALARDRYSDHGTVMTRIGRAPKRAMLFRCDSPFPKVQCGLIAPNGDTAQKIELLALGQQVVAFGNHPDTGLPYRWHGGDPTTVAREALPLLTAEDAATLVADLVELLTREHGYRPASTPRKGNGAPADTATGGADWQALFAAIHAGVNLHDSMRTLAAKMIASGAHAGAVANQLRALMEGSQAPKDDRWRERVREIPRLVASAEAKYAEDRAQRERATKRAEQAARAAAFAQAQAQADPTADPTEAALAAAVASFGHWLLLPDLLPLYAMLGAVAANLLDGPEGDPVWLLIVGPPSSAKTELIMALSDLPMARLAAVVTPPALLSGTPVKQRAKGAKGGLLRNMANPGLLLLKDFGSVLSMRYDAREETIAALREVYDKKWVRIVGSEGGTEHEWSGKLGLIAGVTEKFDTHHAVIGAMGDRFLLSRLKPVRGQYLRARQHTRGKGKAMRAELANAVATLLGQMREPRPVTDAEAVEIEAAAALTARLRTPVERDRVTRELTAVFSTEGTGRLGLALESLLNGLDSIGLDRMTALAVMHSVALDSAPPLRRAAYELLASERDLTGGYKEWKTTAVAEALDRPTSPVKYALEDLTTQGLAKRTKNDGGNLDLWTRIDDGEAMTSERGATDADIATEERK